jgi:hypothetical protein
VLTDTRFYIGVAVGAGLVMFVLPWLRGAMASRSSGA